MILSSRGYKLAAICAVVMALSSIGMLVLFINFQGHQNNEEIIIIGFSILSALMSTSLTILMFDVLLRREASDELQEIVIDAVESSVKSSLKLKKFGVNEIHQSFDKNVFHRAAIGSSEIFVLQTYVPNMASLRRTIIDVLKSGGKVRFLILDPDSNFVDIRTRETPSNHEHVDDFKGEIKSTITRFKGFSGVAGSGSAEIRIYDRSPGVCIYGTGRNMLVSPFLSNLDAAAAPQIELDSSSESYNLFLDHFNFIWNSAKKLEL